MHVKIDEISYEAFTLNLENDFFKLKRDSGLNHNILRRVTCVHAQENKSRGKLLLLLILKLTGFGFGFGYEELRKWTLGKRMSLKMSCKD